MRVTVFGIGYVGLVQAAVLGIGSTPPSERVNLALIGSGGRGMADRDKDPVRRNHPLLARGDMPHPDAGHAQGRGRALDLVL